MGLKEYQEKRHFGETPEPAGEPRPGRNGRRFVVQEHHASHLHYDLRLEVDGVLKSWAVPKGPSLDPGVRRLAMQTEDHPLEYADFEGTIPEGNYGAGEVAIWDHGTYEPVEADPEEALRKGSLGFRLHGKKLGGEFRLVCTGCRDDKEPERWLLIKKRDEGAQPGYELQSVLPGKKHKPRRKSVKATDGAPPGDRPSTPRRPSPRGGTPVLSLAEFTDSTGLSGGVVVQAEGQEVGLTHLDRVYWPDEGITKGDLLRYYACVADTILPYLRSRPAILRRQPRGIASRGFYQHDVPNPPEWIRTEAVETEEGRIVHYAVYTDLASLLYLANLGAIEQHPWHSRVEDLDHPDYLVLDLDPNEAEFADVLEVALTAREVLGDLRLKGCVKTSGSRGAHVYVPLGRKLDYDEASRLGEEISGQVVERRPEIATGQRSLRRREKGKVYVDWVQNARGKTAAAPYSVRARPGATVSTPLTWDELERGIRPEEFTLASVPARLERVGDPWEGMLFGGQKLDRALRIAA